MTTDLTPTITDDEVRELPLAGARADLLRELLAETGAAAEPVRRPRRWLPPLVAAAAVLAVAVPVAVTQLSGDGGSTSPGIATDPGTVAPAAFQVRTVGLSSEYPPSDDPERAEVESFICPQRPVAEAPEKAQLACDDRGVRYLLGAAAIEGGVVSAQAQIPQNQVNYVVTVQLDEQGSEALAELSSEFVGTAMQIALVLDGTVLSAPTVNGMITGGLLQISGDFTRADAEALAARLAPQP